MVTVQKNKQMVTNQHRVKVFFVFLNYSLLLNVCNSCALTHNPLGLSMNVSLTFCLYLKETGFDKTSHLQQHVTN